MNRNCLLILALWTIYCASQAALAEPIPLSKISCSSVEITPIMQTDELKLHSWSSTSIIRDQSTRGEPDVSEHCVGTTMTHGDQTTMRGYCVSLNPNGDQVLVEVSREGEGPGTWQLIDGTGGSAGITGTGSFRVITEARPIQEGTWQGCNEIEGNYTVPE